MKTRQNKTLAALIVLASITGFSSCKKEQMNSLTKTKANLIGVDATYNEMLRMTMSMGVSGSFKTEDADAIPGAIVTDDTLSNPHTRTIDYGSGCIDNYGKIYKGQIIISYTTRDFLHVAGASVAITPVNYSVDDHDISGTTTLQNDGVNGNGNVTLTYNVNAKRVRIDNGAIDSLGGQQVVEWVAGSDTEDKSDDQLSFTGLLGGHSTQDGDFDFAINILQPLIKNRANDCNEFFVKGETLTQVSGQSDVYLDYGDGTCDDLGVETIDGISTTITL